MNELQKRAGHDEVAGAPAAAKAPQKLTDVAAAIKIAELQAGLEALKQGHSVVVDMLNAKVNSLRAENDSQKREITGLNSAFQWAYNYKEIPRRHWLEQGRSEECADAMENLLKGMKQAIENLWVGGNRETITINFDLRDGDGSFIRADHDESLMPYWKELAAALKHWSEYHANGKYLHVQIFDIELPKAVLGILLPAFEQSRIETIYFYDTIHQKSRHTGEMADFVKKVLQTNLFITRLLFSFIKFSQEDVKIICGAIKARNVGGRIIEFLRLVHCFEGGIDTHILNMILASVATANGDVALSLWYNGMSSREAAVITEFLRLNPSLKRLTLRGNRFDDGDAALLADALSSNTHLGIIGIKKNGMTENGRLAFLRAIFDVSSLSSCAASNHTCSVRGFKRDISVLNRDESDSINKWSKIFAMLALSSEDSFIDISLLCDVPVQLIPVIFDKCNHVGFTDDYQALTNIYLELTTTTRCQKHDDWDSLGETKSLNCIYNLVRSWAVPSIFV